MFSANGITVRPAFERDLPYTPVSRESSPVRAEGLLWISVDGNTLLVNRRLSEPKRAVLCAQAAIYLSTEDRLPCPLDAPTCLIGAVFHSEHAAGPLAEFSVVGSRANLYDIQWPKISSVNLSFSYEGR